MSKLEIKGKTVLVTGANRGLGKAIVTQLIKKGAEKVYAGSRNIKNLTELSSQFQDKVIPIQLDITNLSNIENAAKQIDRLDILINNAGIMSQGQLLSKESFDSLQKNFEVNVWGPLRLVNSLHHHFEGKGSKAIVNIISVSGLGNMPILGTYSVSKAALHSVNQGIRGQLGSQTLVVGVYPGPMKTDMIDEWDMDKADTILVAKNILQGVENGIEDIFPDPMSKQVGSLYLSSPKKLEQNFASM